MVKRVSIAGATGYTGGELSALLARHPGARLVGLFGSGSGSGGARLPFGSLHSSLAGAEGPDVEPLSAERLLEGRPDVVFLATPHETSADVAPKLLSAGVRVIDLSGAFRLASAADYERWYGFAHPSPELLEEAVYGLTEWCDGGLERARLVANPGCYPTSVLLALKPLAGLLAKGETIVCDSKSGVSGAGKKSDLSYSFAELAGNFKAYGAGVHRHEPEMRRGLGLSDEASFVFVPHLLPVVRGILSTIHVAFPRPVAAAEVEGAFRSAYEGKPFVRVRPAGNLPELKDVAGTPRAEIGFALLPGGRRAVLVSVIDNLLKGAASQAVQNFNRMAGFPEKEGLT